MMLTIGLRTELAKPLKMARPRLNNFVFVWNNILTLAHAVAKCSINSSSPKKTKYNLMLTMPHQREEQNRVQDETEQNRLRQAVENAPGHKGT